jgi:ABC-type multidrug transport system ATPase subunit
VLVIETKRLTKYYGKTRGIENLNLSIEEGEVFGYLGPNGAGKITTIRLLLNLIFPTWGKAEVFGKNVVKEGVKIREKVGYISGDVSLYEGIRPFILFYYYHPYRALQGNLSYHFLVLLGLFFFFTAVPFLIFSRKDIAI